MTTLAREDELRHDIEHTREQLGDTVEALVHRVDVPARVKNKAQDVKEILQAKVEEAKQHLHKGTEMLQDKAEVATVQAKWSAPEVRRGRELDITDHD
ncbi:MAG: DUF3618 domain-containing protein [Pseudonocardiaceae bacterium]